MSLPDESVDTYYQMDEVKENLDEDGETPNENRLQNWGNQIDRWLDGELKWLFDNDLTKFPLDQQDWIDNGFTANEFKQLQNLATEGLELKFWKETNAQDQPFKEWEKKVKLWIKNLIQIPATSEVAG